MQSLETGPDIWRRASPSPAPPPVLKSSQPILDPGILGPKSARRAAFLAPAGAPARRTSVRVVILFGLVILAFAANGPLRATASPLVAEIERWLDLAGFGLHQVSITGYRFTADGDIYEAIDLEHARTFLSFDSRAAQRRIEALPWVDTASIERILPDRLEVRITERTPIAVWQRAEGFFLIDATGRVLAAVPSNRLPALPRVAGEGAPEATAALLGVLAAHPAVLNELTLAERVGARRWTLRLADGGSILLPAIGEAAALARAVVIRNALARRGIAIDLRVASRPLIAGAPASGPSGGT